MTNQTQVKEQVEEEAGVEAAIGQLKVATQAQGRVESQRGARTPNDPLAAASLLYQCTPPKVAWKKSAVPVSLPVQPRRRAAIRLSSLLE